MYDDSMIYVSIMPVRGLCVGCAWAMRGCTWQCVAVRGNAWLYAAMRGNVGWCQNNSPNKINITLILPDTMLSVHSSIPNKITFRCLA